MLFQKKADVIFLQEAHTDIKTVINWKREWGGVSIFSYNSSVSSGVAILFFMNFSPDSYQVNEIVKGSLLKVKANVDIYVFVFICVYVPTDAIERLSFLSKL